MSRVGGIIFYEKDPDARRVAHEGERGSRETMEKPKILDGLATTFVNCRSDRLLI